MAEKRVKTCNDQDDDTTTKCTKNNIRRGSSCGFYAIRNCTERKCNFLPPPNSTNETCTQDLCSNIKRGFKQCVYNKFYQSGGYVPRKTSVPGFVPIVDSIISTTKAPFKNSTNLPPKIVKVRSTADPKIESKDFKKHSSVDTLLAGNIKFKPSRQLNKNELPFGYESSIFLLRQGTLRRKTKYKLSIKVYDDSKKQGDLIGEVSLSFETHTQKQGKCIIQNRNGEEIKTEFVIRCKNWREKVTAVIFLVNCKVRREKICQ